MKISAKGHSEWIDREFCKKIGLETDKDMAWYHISESAKYAFREVLERLKEHDLMSAFIAGFSLDISAKTIAENMDTKIVVTIETDIE